MKNSKSKKDFHVHSGLGVPSHTPASAGGPGYPSHLTDSGRWHPARGLGGGVCVCTCICTLQGVFTSVGMHMCTCVRVHVCVGCCAYV